MEEPQHKTSITQTHTTMNTNNNNTTMNTTPHSYEYSVAYYATKQAATRILNQSLYDTAPEALDTLRGLVETLKLLKTHHTQAIEREAEARRAQAAAAQEKELEEAAAAF